MADINDFKAGVQAIEQQSSEINNLQNELASRQETLNTPYYIKDTESGVELPVDNEEDLSLAIVSGKYKPEPTEIFNVITPDGRRGTVDADNIEKVLRNGQARLETAEETLKLDDEQKYGDKDVQAAALGAARGVSFGASDAALKATGLYTGEELRGIESANPVSSIAGEVGGIGTQALLSGGTSLLAKGASSTLRASELLGAKAAAATTKYLVKNGVQKGAAKSIAQRLLSVGAPQVANLAAQGSLQGVGRLITENTFGTAEMNAENLLSYAGVGALFGGTFGAVIGTGKALAPSAKSVLNRVTDSLTPQAFNKEIAATNLADLSDAAMAKAKIKMPDFEKELVNTVEDVLEKRKPKTRQDFHASIANEWDEVGSEIGNIFKKTDEVLKSASDDITTINPKTAMGVSSNVMKTVDDYVSKLGIAVKQEQIDALRKYGTNFAEKLGVQLEKNGISATSLQDVAKSLQDAIYPKTTGKAPVVLSLEEDSLKALQKEILDTVRNEQRDLIRLATERGQDNLFDKYLSLNKRYRVLSEIKFNSLKKAEKMEPGAAEEIIGFNLTTPLRFIKKGMDSYTVQKAAIFQSLEKSLKTNDSAISNMLNNVIKGTELTAKATATGVSKLAKAAEPVAVKSLTSYALADKMVDGKKRKPKNEDEAYRNIIDNASVALTDPESVLKQSNKATSALFEHAPATAAAIDAKYLQMMQFIASKNKGSKKKSGVFDVSKLAPVSAFEKAKMNRYLEAIEDPVKVLEKAGKGSLSREHVEVIKSLYPELHKKIKMQTLETLSKKNVNLSYQQKLQLGLLLDLNAHESMDAENIRGLQSMFSEEQQSAETPVNMKEFNKSDSLASDLEQHEIGGN